jgi:integrase
MVVRKSGVTVRVFTAARKGVQSYLIAYYLGGKRHRETFRGILDAAKVRAEEIARQISQQAAGDGVLPMADVRAYNSAVEALKPLGVALPVAVAEYIAARQKIRNRPLADAVDYYARQACLDMPPKLLAEVAQEMLDAKKKDGVSLRYLQELRRVLEPVCDALTKPIAEITSGEIDDYVRSLAFGSRSRKNVRDSIVTAFEFAKGRNYLPRDRETAAALSTRVKVKSTNEIEIFTPKEMAALLAAASADALPLIALGGFAGLRTAEIGRLEWKDIDFAHGIITVSAAKAKTAARRIVPMSDNLKAWLAPYAKASGSVAKVDHLEDQSAWSRLAERQAEVAKAAKVEWKHNALRHSFGSYRLAQIKNAAEVALEMGNSPQMIFKHYRELVRPADAAAWWAITPQKGA